MSELVSEVEFVLGIPSRFVSSNDSIPVYEQLVNLDKLLREKTMQFVGAPLNIKDGDGMIVRPIVLVY